MNVILDKLLSQVYELEGLLLVIERHKHETSPFIYEMIQRKVERINELAVDCTPEMFSQPQPMSIAPQPATFETFGQDESIDDDFEEEIEQEEVIEEQEAEDEIIEENTETEEVDDFAETTYVEYDEEAIPEAELDYTDTVEVEPYADEIVDEPAQEYQDQTEPEIIEIIEENNEDDFNYNEEDELDEVIDEDNEDPIKLDEYLQRSLSKDLSKAFTLNDRFRYRRELFGNSEVEMCNTINMVEAMKSYSEAEDYFYGDLEWDKESTEVADFMSIIKKHFL